MAGDPTRKYDHYDMANDPNLAVPQYDHIFSATIDDLVGMALEDPRIPGQLLTMTEDGSARSLEFACEQITGGDETVGEVNIPFYNVEFYTSNGKTSYTPLRVTMRRFVGGLDFYLIAKALKEGAASGRTGEGRQAVADDAGNSGYMFTFHKIERRLDRMITRMVKFEWAWVRELTEPTTNRKGGSQQTFDMTIRFNRKTEEVIPVA
jgi:hypothetical protein